MTTLDAALDYHRRGLRVVPLHYRSKRPAVKWKDLYANPLSREQIHRWFSSTLRNIAVLTGHRGLTVLDFDDLAAYNRWFLWATRHGGYVATLAHLTYRVQTARGIHLYVRLPYRTRSRMLRDVGIDIKGYPGYIVLPPSVHPDGFRYRTVSRAVVVFPVDSLSDILPTSMLLDDQAQPPSLREPLTRVHDDPWRVAEYPGVGDDLVSRIKGAYRLEDFFTDLHDSSPDGRWKLARCPFHDDQHPSFWLDTEQQICGCFAGCTSKPLDVINLYARLNDLSNREAIRMLALGLRVA